LHKPTKECTFAAKKSKNKEEMKKFIFLFLMVMCCSFESHAIELDGKYLSQSGELLFIFKSDSLYIDIAQSMRTVSAFKLVKNKETQQSTTFNAYESYMDKGRPTYREVLIKVSFMKEKEYLLEYFGKDKDRDYNSNERYNIRLVE
jgi:hypothetical protein